MKQQANQAVIDLWTLGGLMKLLTYVDDPRSWLAVEGWQSEVDT